MSGSRDCFVHEVWACSFDEYVALDNFGGEDSSDRQLLGLSSAGHKVNDGSFLAARSADCVNRCFLHLSCHVLGSFSNQGVGLGLWLAGKLYSPTSQNRILMTKPIPPTIPTPSRLILIRRAVSSQSGF